MTQLKPDMLTRRPDEVQVYCGPAHAHGGAETVRVFMSSAPDRRNHWRFRAVFSGADGQPCDERSVDRERVGAMRITIRRFGKPDFVFDARRLSGRARANVPLPFNDRRKS